ncbi:energy transducer TonB [Roseovarius amoyensis]|uniref:energy transducer TonB n=1 Tax=Roseovarius amoyensis TaxID=2211448 RepID=UPI000DBE21DA|nr:energy transducer TonB [Roseovarius amoyensis]
MNTGQIISAAGHAGLILWAVLGGAFDTDPQPYEVTQVTAISAEDYAALIAADRAPDAVANVDTPDPPEAGAAPSLSSEADTPPEQSQPPATETAEPDPVPEPPEATPPEAEVSDAPPVQPSPPEETAVLVPEISERPQPRPAPRVAPEPVARPEPDVQIDDVDRVETAPDDSPEVVEQDSQETAREEAATRIVTEAEKAAAAAPAWSLRPRTRPAPRPEPESTVTAQQPAQETTPQVDDAAVDDAVAAALAAAGAGTGDTGTPAGPPLTAGEKDALRVAVQQCWNVGSLSSEALATTVVVTVSMSEDGRPEADSIRMTSYSGGSADAADRAFAAARRAIIRCGTNGYDLPFEKYEQWRNIEMTFNPERMRIK